MDKKKLIFNRDHYEDLWKIMVLPLVTFCIYLLYWEYYTWKFIKEEKQSNISPGWRVVAGIIPMIFWSMMFYDILTIVSNMKKRTAVICAVIWASLFYVGPNLSLEHSPKELLIYYYFSSTLPILMFQHLINKYILKSKEI